jgi:hypothetical protein
MALSKDIFRSYEANKNYFEERWNEYFSRRVEPRAVEVLLAAE